MFVLKMNILKINLNPSIKKENIFFIKQKKLYGSELNFVFKKKY